MVCNTDMFEDETVQSCKAAKRRMHMLLRASQTQACVFNVKTSGCHAKHASNRCASTGQLQTAMPVATPALPASFAYGSAMCRNAPMHRSMFGKHDLLRCGYKMGPLDICDGVEQYCHHLAGPDQRHVAVSQKHRPS